MTSTSLSTRRGAARPPRRRRSLDRGGLFGWLFLAPFAVLFLVVFVVPIVISVRAAFFRDVPAEGGLYGGGGLVETYVGFANLIAAVTSSAFWNGMWRVLLFAIIQIPVMIVVALVLALLLDSLVIRRVAFFRMAFFLPFAIPGIIAAMMWVYLYTPELSPFTPFLPDGADLMSPGVILLSMANMTTWTYTGYNMLIFLAALQSIPNDLYEAARLDGAGGFRVALQVKVPLVRDAALLAVLLSIIGTIQLFNEPMVMEAANPWMGKDFTPMMLTYNSLMGLVSPSGSGAASAFSLLMAVIAGGLALIYTKIEAGVARR